MISEREETGMSERRAGYLFRTMKGAEAEAAKYRRQGNWAQAARAERAAAMVADELKRGGRIR